MIGIYPKIIPMLAQLRLLIPCCMSIALLRAIVVQS